MRMLIAAESEGRVQNEHFGPGLLFLLILYEMNAS